MLKCLNADLASVSCLQVRHHQAWRISDAYLWYWGREARDDGLNRRLAQCWTVHHDAGSCERTDAEEDPCQLCVFESGGPDTSLLLMISGVVPGMVITELWDKMGQSKEQQKETFEKVGKTLPVGFVATPEDVSTASFCRAYVLTLV